MKLSAVIISVVLLQASASFFDDFRGAIISVETSFGKLLSDVAADVTEAIDCTIIAVEHVLSLDQFFSPGSNDRRCGGSIQSTYEPPSVQIVPEQYQPDPPRLVTSEDFVIQSAQRNDDNVAKALEEHIEASIAIANQTLFDIVEHRDSNQKMEEVRSVLKNETDRLNEVSKLVRKELNSISTNVQSDLNKIVIEDSGTSAEKILDNLNLLHEIELTNKSEATEIKKVFNEISDLLDVKEINREHDGIASELYKTNEGISIIEGQLLKWRQEPNAQHPNKTSEFMHEQNGTKELPKTFKEVAKVIMNNGDVSDKSNNNRTSTDIPIISVRVMPTESDSTAKVVKTKPPMIFPTLPTPISTILPLNSVLPPSMSTIPLPKSAVPPSTPTIPSPNGAITPSTSTKSPLSVTAAGGPAASKIPPASTKPPSTSSTPAQTTTKLLSTSTVLPQTPTIPPPASTKPPSKTMPPTTSTLPPPKSIIPPLTSTMPPPTTTTTEPPTTTPSLESLIPLLPDDSLDNDTFFDFKSFFNIAPPASDAHKEHVEHAKQVMETSQFSDLIMSSYLGQAENAASVFDSPDLFNFEQRK